jgi:hypothetical protein
MYLSPIRFKVSTVKVPNAIYMRRVD